MKVGGGKRDTANVVPKVERAVSREGMPQPTKDLGTVMSSPSGIPGQRPIENEFGVFYACQEAAGSKDSAYL